MFEDIGYARLQRDRMKRYIREGREGESLGFYNRPDLNDPWTDPPVSDAELLAAGVVFLIMICAIIAMIVHG